MTAYKIINNITMNQKHIYIAPEVESIEIKLETGIMGFSNDGKGTASASAMTEDTETFGSAW